MGTIRIKKQKSTLQLFKDAESSYDNTIEKFLSFVDSEPVLSNENKLAIVSALFAPQWLEKASYNEIRIGLVRACWEKMCQYPKNNVVVRQAINDLAQFAFYAQSNNDLPKLTKLGDIIYKLTANQPICEPIQAQFMLRQSSWGPDKAVGLVLAKPGQWQKMNKISKEQKDRLYYLVDHKRIWR